MKKIYLLLVIVFAACKSNSGASDIADSAKTISAIDHSQDLIKKFKPIIQGMWVKKEYVDMVIATKSPLAASDKCNGITVMYINTDNIHGDSLVFMAGYFNHDGADVTVKFEPGKKPSTILFNGKDLSYSIKNGDTTISVFQYDQRLQRQVKAQYIRVFKKQSDDDLEYGMSFYINKFLLEGNYNLIDSANSNAKVCFSADGKVTGFLDYSSYSINVDLNSEPMNNLDEIGFDIRMKHPNSFTFKINADTLNLYKTYPNTDSTKSIRGKLAYKLVRIK